MATGALWDHDPCLDEFGEWLEQGFPVPGDMPTVHIFQLFQIKHCLVRVHLVQSESSPRSGKFSASKMSESTRVQVNSQSASPSTPTLSITPDSIHQIVSIDQIIQNVYCWCVFRNKVGKSWASMCIMCTVLHGTSAYFFCCLSLLI